MSMLFDPRIQKVLAGLKTGTINESEADQFLRAYSKTTLAEVRQAQEQKAQIVNAPQTKADPFPTPKPVPDPIHDPAPQPAINNAKKAVIAMWLIALIIIPVFFIYAPDITANLALDVPTQNITNTTIPIDQAITSLHVSGLLYGDGSASIYFDTPEESLLIATINSEDGLPRTDQAGYNAGDTVDVVNKPEGASYYLDDGTSTTPIDLPFAAPEADTELLVVTAAETYRLPIIIGEAQRVLAFTSICGEACAMQPASGLLRIEATEAQVQLTSIDAGVVAPNTAPELTAPLPSLTVTTSTTLDLNEYFSDADGDELQYAVGNNDHVAATIDGSTLTLTAVTAGQSHLTIYASDLQELVPATLEVTSAAVDTPPQTNETTEPAPVIPPNTTAINDTLETNETTEPAPVIPPNTTAINTTLDCSAPNPNDRPAECLLLQEQEYFVDQDIFWENGARERKARFTIIGNLLITGDLIENSPGQPSASDFQLGYVDRDFNSVSTIWIDSEGNLHLRGSLHEENANLNPPAGAYTIGTKRGIYVAYADLNTGDLHIRGNLIPYRRSIA